MQCLLEDCDRFIKSVKGISSPRLRHRFCDCGIVSATAASIPRLWHRFRDCGITSFRCRESNPNDSSCASLRPSLCPSLCPSASASLVFPAIFFLGWMCPARWQFGTRYLSTWTNSLFSFWWRRDLAQMAIPHRSVAKQEIQCGFIPQVFCKFQIIRQRIITSDHRDGAIIPKKQK